MGGAMASVSVSVRKRGRILTSCPRILDVYSLLVGITPTIVDVLDLFCGRKNVRFGVNGNPAVHTIQKSFQCEKPREKREDKWFEVIRVFGWKQTGVVALEKTRTQKEYNRREYGSEYTVGFKDKS